MPDFGQNTTSGSELGPRETLLVDQASPLGRGQGSARGSHDFISPHFQGSVFSQTLSSGRSQAVWPGIGQRGKCFGTNLADSIKPNQCRCSDRKSPFVADAGHLRPPADVSRRPLCGSFAGEDPKARKLLRWKSLLMQSPPN